VPAPNASCPSAWRRPFAILIAYGIALQLVLSGVSAILTAAWGTGHADATCLRSSTAAGDAFGHASDNFPICPSCGFACVMTGCAAVGDASRVTIRRPTLIVVNRLRRPTLSAGSRRRLAASPHNPRAPPA
jgi:hypothetical protein